MYVFLLLYVNNNNLTYYFIKISYMDNLIDKLSYHIKVDKYIH